MKPCASFAEKESQGYNFFLVLKRINDDKWKPVYKSEIKPRINGKFEWNVVNLLITDVVSEGLLDEFKIEFFQS